MTSETSRSKKWRRWMQDNRGKEPYIPDKYRFTEHLTHVGDYVETYPMSKEDAVRMSKAAYQWSWQHRCRVMVNRIPAPANQYVVRVTLKARVRIRDFK